MILWFGRRKKRRCSCCGGELKRVTVRREIDPQKERVTIGRTRVVYGSAVEFCRVWRCTACEKEE